MKKVNFLFLEIIAATVLVILWVLSAGSKLADMAHFKDQLSKQVFSREFVSFLFVAVPVSEILAALLLVRAKTRLAGFALSALLMILFTGYIALVLAGYYASVPCACISLIKGMGFKSHLYLNLFFVAVALAGLNFKIKYYYEKVS